MPDCIEEDFRFATPEQVASYTENERAWKPHLAGYELSQLLDQLDEQILQHEGRVFRLVVAAPAGTALCVAQHCRQAAKPAQLTLLLESTLPAIVSTLGNEVCFSSTFKVPFADCVLIAATTDEKTQQHLAAADVALPWQPRVVYDPKRRLCRDKRGHYFLNSTIWVRPWKLC